MVFCAMGLAAMAGPSGCTLAPEGAKPEKARLESEGVNYERAFEQRELPELAGAPTWPLVLRRAFLGNGDLEGAYYQWMAAVERIDAASAYPNTNVQLEYSYMFSSESMKTFNRQTFSAGFDSSMNLSFPTKVSQQGRVALAEAKEAGARFLAARFDLQKKVLFAWADYKALAAKIALREQDLALRRMSLSSARVAASTVGSSVGLVGARTSLEMGENDLLEARAELGSMRSMLNGLLAREADEPLGVPAPDEAIPEVPEDATALQAAVESFPEVAVDVERLQGRRDALELARLQWIPDFAPTAMFTGNVSQAIGAVVMLPTNVVRIRSMIHEAEAGVLEAEAMLRQKRADRMGEYVSLLILARDARRRADFTRDTLVPLAERWADLRGREYSAGAGEFMQVIEARQMVIEARMVGIEAERLFERAMVDISCCLGIGLDQIGKPPARPDAVESETERATDRSFEDDHTLQEGAH